MANILDKLWAYWPLGETGGTRFDVSGYNRHLGEYLDPIGNAPGKIGNAAVLSVITKILAIPGSDVFPNTGNPYTVSFWYKHNNPGANSAPLIIVLSKQASSGEVVIWVWRDTVHDASHDDVFDSSAEGFAESGFVVTQSAWHFVVVQMSLADGLQVFVDNVLVGSNPAVTSQAIELTGASLTVHAERDTTDEYLLNALMIGERAFSSQDRDDLWNNGNGVDLLDNLNDGGHFDPSGNWVYGYTVTFNVNGSGSGSMGNQTATVPTTLTGNAFTWLGHTFLGWSTQADGLGVFYADGAIYSFGASITLYAQWIGFDPPTPIEEDLTIPKIMMRYSKDGGYTFGPEKWRGAGHIGEYLYRCRWPGNLGRARKPFVEFSGESNARIVIIDAYVDVETGTS